MNKKLLLLPALLGALMFAPSCGDADACKDVDCGTNGNCFNGECICLDGYELGTDKKCSVVTRNKFLGNYQAGDSCAGTAKWNSSITASSQAVNKIVISNFGNSGQNVVCTVNGRNLTIDAGQITKGSGTINANGNQITLDFDNPAPPPASCKMTLDKQ